MGAALLQQWGGGVTLVDQGFSMAKAGKESCGSTLLHQKRLCSEREGTLGHLRTADSALRLLGFSQQSLHTFNKN